LKQLRIENRKTEADPESGSEDDEEEDERKASAIIRKAVAESQLELVNDEDADQATAKDDELPWCQL
jgi:hypothetical protein